MPMDPSPMELKSGPARLPLLSPQRPVWQRVLVWVGIGFLAINLLPLVFFITGSLAGNLFGPRSMLGGWLGAWGVNLGSWSMPLSLFLLFLPFGGLNLLRTGANGARATFKRRDDPARGGYLYDVRPARASWLTVLTPLPLFAVLSMVTPWVLIFWPALVAIFVLPGARHRKPVTISVSPQGIYSNDVSLPLDRVAEMEVVNRGVKVAREPLMPGPGGLSTSGMIGRGLGRRQAARSFTLTLRSDGESRATVIAGGLTEDCAINLQRDIENAVARFETAP